MHNGSHPRHTSPHTSITHTKLNVMNESSKTPLVIAFVVPAGDKSQHPQHGRCSVKPYAPPNHRDGVVHHTRDQAQADNEHFDGSTTE